jgi:outer membrane receptor protein involved in Fe transport
LTFIVKDHRIRAGYGRAFKSPTILESHLFLDGFVLGNRNGFQIRDAATGTMILAEIDPLVPEEVQTAELGYKATLAPGLYAEAVAHYSWYKNFISAVAPWRSRP